MSLSILISFCDEIFYEVIVVVVDNALLFPNKLQLPRPGTTTLGIRILWKWLWYQATTIKIGLRNFRLEILFWTILFIFFEEPFLNYWFGTQFANYFIFLLETRKLLLIRCQKFVSSLFCQIYCSAFGWSSSNVDMAKVTIQFIISSNQKLSCEEHNENQFEEHLVCTVQ